MDNGNLTRIRRLCNVILQKLTFRLQVVQYNIHIVIDMTLLSLCHTLMPSAINRSELKKELINANYPSYVRSVKIFPRTILNIGNKHVKCL